MKLRDKDHFIELIEEITAEKLRLALYNYFDVSTLEGFAEHLVDEGLVPDEDEESRDLALLSDFDVENVYEAAYEAETGVGVTVNYTSPTDDSTDRSVFRWPAMYTQPALHPYTREMAEAYLIEHAGYYRSNED